MVPSASEAQMGPADAAPDEEAGESRKREKPVEELIADIGGLIDESEQGKSQLKGDSGERPTLSVNISQNLRSHTL